MNVREPSNDSSLFGVGSYTDKEAARLVRTSPRNIARWLKGYTYRQKGVARDVEPLWPTQWEVTDGHLEIGFRDLIELRFVKRFLDAGLGLLAVRNCLVLAREYTGDDHPFSTRRFKTDGKTIFLESLERSCDEPRMLDLKRRQYVFRQIIERSFKDLDIENDAVARWRPFHGKASIVIDPHRSFGQPIATDYGVPTVALADAVSAEGSVERAAILFDVSPSTVRDAVQFEHMLQAA
jgi:uncharacterized protein (DUF433 family)